MAGQLEAGHTVDNELDVKPISLTMRGCLAVALMAGFYLVASLFLLLMVAIPLVPLMISDTVIPWLFAVCWPTAFLLIIALLPRWRREKIVGIQLQESDSPELFALVRRVAERTKEAVPCEVWLDDELNACVAQKGGVWGFFGKRIMIIGLPLLEVLTPREVEAVLAHEFGHYSGGDTMFSAWICRTRDSLLRTVAYLEGRDSQKIFELVGNLFFRVTHAISRRQEFLADQVAAAVTDARTFASALVKIRAYGYYFADYYYSEWLPFLDEAVVPAFMDGFRLGLTQEGAQAFLAKPVTALFEEEDAEEKKGDNRYATHPTLQRRLAALGVAPDGISMTRTGAQRLAIADETAIERRLLDAIQAQRKDGQSWQHIPWSELFEKYYVPWWLEKLNRFAPALRDLKMRDVIFLVRDKGRLYQRFSPALSGAKPTNDFFKEILDALDSATKLAMWRAGCHVKVMPLHGISVFLADKNGQTPITSLQCYFDGRPTGTWFENCERLGVSDLRFDDVVQMICAWNALRAGYNPQAMRIPLLNVSTRQSRNHA